jgi:hypothetical protein
LNLVMAHVSKKVTQCQRRKLTGESDIGIRNHFICLCASFVCSSFVKSVSHGIGTLQCWLPSSPHTMITICPPLHLSCLAYIFKCCLCANLAIVYGSLLWSYLYTFDRGMVDDPGRTFQFIKTERNCTEDD